jgi:hypothetical protein
VLGATRRCCSGRGAHEPRGVNVWISIGTEFKYQTRRRPRKHQRPPKSAPNWHIPGAIVDDDSGPVPHCVLWAKGMYTSQGQCHGSMSSSVWVSPSHQRMLAGAPTSGRQTLEH